MKSYVVTSGVVFTLVTLVHLWRLAAENRGLAADPWFIFATGVSAALAFWAWRVLARQGK